MNCAEIRLLLHGYADNELDAARSLELESHLKTCPACADQIKSLRALKSALGQNALRHSAPASFRNELRRSIRPPTQEAGAGLLQSLRFWKSLAFGATAAAVLILFARPPGPSSADRFIDGAIAGHVRSLMPGHLTDVASSDQHTVKPWFNGKLDFAPDVKDFAPQGFVLVGGRLDYLDGRTVAALVYRRNQHPINVFVWPAAKERSSTLHMEQRRGYTVINRETGGLHYCLVSDLNEKELTELADLLGR
jgi:anti-sigma factor RsiW